MTYSFWLEAINSSITVTSLFALGVFLHYIWLNWNEGYIFLRPAIAMSFIWIGEISLRAVIWEARHAFNSSPEGANIAPEPIILAVGYFILIAATLCCIRVFSPKEWGHKPWLLALAMSIVIAILSVAT